MRSAWLALLLTMVFPELATAQLDNRGPRQADCAAQAMKLATTVDGAPMYRIGGMHHISLKAEKSGVRLECWGEEPTNHADRLVVFAPRKNPDGVRIVATAAFQALPVFLGEVPDDIEMKVTKCLTRAKENEDVRLTPRAIIWCRRSGDSIDFTAQMKK